VVVPGLTVTELPVEPPGIQVKFVALVALAVNVVEAPEQIEAGAALGFKVGVAVTFTDTVPDAGHIPPFVTVTV
jgi:hypothetical protein